jgi:hypothetical protein
VTTAVCAWCEVKEETLTILDGTPIEQALLDLEAEDLTHGICKRHAAALREEAGI